MTCSCNDCIYNTTMPARRAAATSEPSRAEPPLPEPHGCSSLRVRALSRRVSQFFDQHIAAAGLKTTQYSLLSHVVELGPLRPGELARRMNLEPSTLTRNLRPLVAAGWVVVEGGTDERSRMVRATAAGAAKRAEAKRAWKKAQLAFNARMGVATVARLHEAVDACMQALADDAEASRDA